MKPLELFDPCGLTGPYPDYCTGWRRVRCWLWRLYYALGYNMQDLKDWVDLASNALAGQS